ncbi:hypothetical protein U3516DRAFT_829839 [Neocallimastix sp. 'constans']
MPKVIKITSDISFKRNDISNPMKDKEDMIPISEYNRFIGKAEKELHDRLDELIRIQKLIHVLKSKVKQLKEENSLESKTCQDIINQINLLEQLRRRSSLFLVQVNRSLNYIEPKSCTKQKEGINEMKNNADDKIHDISLYKKAEFKETKIKVNSHESDFSPPYHGNKNYITYEFQ